MDKYARGIIYSYLFDIIKTKNNFSREKREKETEKTIVMYKDTRIVSEVPDNITLRRIF